MGMLDQAKKLEVRESNLSIIVGEPGCGKTTFAGSFPKPMLYVKLNDDGGDKVLEGIEGIDVLPPLITDEKFFTTLRSSKREGSRMVDKLNQLLVELFTTEHEYKTLVIDPFGELALDMVKTNIRIKGKALTLQERGEIQEVIHPVFTRLKKLSEKMNVVLPCHLKSKEKEDSMTGEKYFKLFPNFTESSATELCKYADMVMYIGIRAVDGETEISKTSKVSNNDYERFGICGANPIMPTKLRLPSGKSMDGVILTELTYEGLQKAIKEA